jgi:hypothetical protein
MSSNLLHKFPGVPRAPLIKQYPPEGARPTLYKPVIVKDLVGHSYKTAGKLVVLRF